MKRLLKASSYTNSKIYATEKDGMCRYQETKVNVEYSFTTYREAQDFIEGLYEDKSCQKKGGE